ncbi:MAG TPA: efflux RND transporter periplasmic adaptor subunit [Alphaproteobacteria bacterium]
MMDGNQSTPDPAPASGRLGLGHEVAEAPGQEESPELEGRRRRTARILGATAVAVVTLLVAVGAWGHIQTRAKALAELAQERDTVPTVRTITAAAVDTPRQLDLPATLQAFNSSTLYARATGYIAKREVDIGSPVHAGDLLALIAAPDLDQQLAQARAQLAQTDASLVAARAALQQARANQDLANVTNQRYAKLAPQGYASQQEADNARLTLAARNADVQNGQAAVDVADANVNAQAANVSRLEQLTSFERVTAPFDGVVSARQVEVGDLVTADASTGTPLFSVARTNVLRVQIYVPQDAVFGLKDGDTAQVLVPEMPGRIFRGTIARNANVLQAGTRTLLTEIDIDNGEGVLRAGIYGIVRLSIPRQTPEIVLPSEAVIFDHNGLSAAVDDNGIVRVRHIELAEDNGAQVVVRAGLNPGDRVIVSPPVDAADGMRVQTSDTDRKVAASSAPPMEAVGKDK